MTEFTKEAGVTGRLSRWLLIAGATLLAACGSENTLLGPDSTPQQPVPAVIRMRDAAQQPVRVEDANPESGLQQHPSVGKSERGRFTRYAMAAA